MTALSAGLCGAGSCRPGRLLAACGRLLRLPGELREAVGKHLQLPLTHTLPVRPLLLALLLRAARSQVKSRPTRGAAWSKCTAWPRLISQSGDMPVRHRSQNDRSACE